MNIHSSFLEQLPWLPLLLNQWVVGRLRMSWNVLHHNMLCLALIELLIFLHKFLEIFVIYFQFMIFATNGLNACTVLVKQAHIHLLLVLSHWLNLAELLNLLFGLLGQFWIVYLCTWQLGTALWLYLVVERDNARCFHIFVEVTGGVCYHSIVPNCLLPNIVRFNYLAGVALALKVSFFAFGH